MTVLEPAETIGALLRETLHALVYRIEREFENTDINLIQWAALNLVSARRITCVGDVTRELGIGTGSPTRLIDRLEGKGLLRRCRSLSDRRVVEIEITEEGLETLDQMQPRVVQFWDNQLRIFSDEERASLNFLLTRLRDRCAEKPVYFAA